MMREESVTDQAQSREPSPRKRNPVQMASDTVIKALIAKGFSVRKAADFMRVSPTTVMRVRKEMAAQAQPGEISGFLSAQRDEKLGRLIDHFLDKGAKLRAVKGSDALGAAKLYADRRYPAREAAPPVTYTFTKINLEEARMDRAPSPATVEIDVEPGPPTTTTERS